MRTRSSVSWSLSSEDFAALAAGASLLGSGGGGDVSIGRNLLAMMPLETVVEVIPAQTLPPDACVVHVGTAGSPDVVSERLVDSADIVRAGETVAESIGCEVEAIGCIEVGGLNALIAVLAAGHLGVPIVDGDLMGRAFPRIHMTLAAAHGYPSTPLSVVGPSGDVAVVHDGSPRRIEAMLAALIDSLGGAAAVGIYPMRAADLCSIGMGPSLSRCIELGRTFAVADGQVTAKLVHILGGSVVIDGVVEQLRTGHPGSLTIANAVEHSVGRVDFIDEFLAVTVDGLCVARTPEIIIAVDRTTNRPVRCDEITRGQSVVVATLPSIHEWPSEALTAVGPQAFGLVLGEE